MSVNYELGGKRIREVRMARQVSQLALAESADLSAAYISRIERARKKTSLESLVKIANVLGVTVDELLTGNQLYDPAEYQTDMDLMLADCSAAEKRILYEVVGAVKRILRENGGMVSKPSFPACGQKS